MVDCQDVVTQYLSFLQSSFRCYTAPGEYRIVTPFLTPDNDPIIVYVSQDRKGGFCLSDRGQAAEFLFLAGLDLETNERQMQMVNSIMHSAQAEFGDGEIFVTTGAEDLGVALHRLLHALQRVYDLVYVEETNSTPVLTGV